MVVTQMAAKRQGEFLYTFVEWQHKARGERASTQRNVFLDSKFNEGDYVVLRCVRAGGLHALLCALKCSCPCSTQGGHVAVETGWVVSVTEASITLSVDRELRTAVESEPAGGRAARLARRGSGISAAAIGKELTTATTDALSTGYSSGKVGDLLFL